MTIDINRAVLVVAFEMVISLSESLTNHYQPFVFRIAGILSSRRAVSIVIYFVRRLTYRNVRKRTWLMSMQILFDVLRANQLIIIVSNLAGGGSIIERDLDVSKVTAAAANSKEDRSRAEKKGERKRWTRVEKRTRGRAKWWILVRLTADSVLHVYLARVEYACTWQIDTN